MKKGILTFILSIVILLFLGCSSDKNEDEIESNNSPNLNISEETNVLDEIITDTLVNRTKLFWLYLHHEELPDALIQTEAPRRDLVVMNAWFHEYVQKFKSINPEIKTLVYKDLTSTRSYAVENGEDNEYLPTGVGFAYADTNYPEWFLVDENDNRLEYTGYANHWQMDIGNTAYQQYWADQVGNELVVNEWDGVLMDNAIYKRDTYHENIYPANYDNDEDFQLAYEAMLSVINTKLDQDNKIGLANITDTRLHPGVWDSYLQHLNGALNEWWLVFGNGNYLSDYPQGFMPQITEVAGNETKNKITLVQPHTSTNDYQGFYYAFASYWLVNNGNTYFSEQEITDDYNNPSPWRDEYNWNFGKAIGNYSQLENGLYKREFTRALVFVNASETASIQIDLDTAYLNEVGEEVNTIVLNALSGTVLRTLNE
ncbi:MAG: putative glycoside hydrolase [Maribacter sp.]